ncbi:MULTISPECIES: D-sedoheptulose-7-phosphate isomerase [unclassified Hahella]|uniref:D-sedoheptulose-7-phosphate isomerase n=1 Tax=unclassified Hahella TaxID=2624107 RepID=UPI001C1F0EEC|nr:MULTISPECIES: D-sedoheptulose 7-phosphate isomerase [unclassified Hahella]MBU6952883.1 D-sedoheptulose 7-phosphate isomerase [Hahella sp. HN01]MDG9670161.1 D-sedoheptulose 7-phosphate isomerase [Hahella sp. CR1]
MNIDMDYVKERIRDSIAVKQRLLADEPLMEKVLRLGQVCVEVYKRGNKVILAGNGGSAADAQHIAAEFVSRFEFDRPGLPALAVTTDTSMLTAIGNDYGYERVFARQVEANAKPGDLFIGITTSGNSKNILVALESAKEMDLITAAFAGSGGKVQELAEHVINVPSTHTPRIQECHIMIGHIICGIVEDAIFGEAAA